MKALEVVIRYGDRSKNEDGDLTWNSPQLRVGLVNGTKLQSMREEMKLIVVALLKQLEDE